MNLTYEQFNFIFIFGLVLAGIFLVVSVILLFVLKIPAVIGDLSGATARKAISEIRDGNYINKNRSVSANKNRTKITEKMTDTSKLSKPKTDRLIVGVTTAGLKSEQLGEKTNVIDTGSAETSVLINENIVPDFYNNEGTIVSDNVYTEQTTVLSDEISVLGDNVPVNVSDFRIRAEIVLFVSDEIIA